MTASSLPDYELTKVVSEGACGQLHVGQEKPPGGRRVAVKILRSIAISRRVLEPALSYLHRHPDSLSGVVAVRAYNLTAPPYSVVSDWMDESEGWLPLSKLAGQKKEAELWPIFNNVAKNLASLHRHGLTHGNLKSTNVFHNTKTGETRLTDVCLGMVGDAHHIDFRDHPLYMAPEQMRRPEGILEGAGQRWDVYSFGVLAYALITGHFPRADRSAAIVREQGVDAARLIPQAVLPEVMSQPAIRWPSQPETEDEGRQRTIVERCLALDPEERWTDMREADRSFHTIAAERELREAKEKTEETRKEADARFNDFQKHSEAGQVRNRMLLKVCCALLALAALYGGYTRYRLGAAEKDVRLAESDKAAATQDLKTQLKTVTDEITTLNTAKSAADTARAYAESRAETYLSGWVDQLVTGEAVTSPSKEQIEETIKSLEPALAKPPATLDDRIRQGVSYGNIAFLQQQIGATAEAASSWSRAAELQDTVLKSDPPAEKVPGVAARLVAAHRALAKIKEEAGQPAEALKSAQNEADALKLLAASKPNDPDVRRKAAEANLRIAEILINQGQEANAKPWLDSVEKLAVQGAEDSLSTESRQIMARVSFLRGVAARHQPGSEKEAMEDFVKAVDYLRTSGVNADFGVTEERMLMARAYTELGEMVGRHFAANDGLQAHTSAVQILEHFVKEKSTDPEVAFLLARNYSEIAHYERDAGKTKDALTRQQAAVGYLKQLLAADPSNYRYNLAYGTALEREAELVETESGEEKSLEVAREAVYALTNTFAEHSDTVIPYWKSEMQFALAQAHRTYGHLAQSLKQNDSAREQYLAAQNLWEKLKAAGFNAELVESGLADLKHLLDLLPAPKPPKKTASEE